MSTTAIDQIQLIAPPVRAATELSQPTASDRPAFQDHLERAASETLPPKRSEPVETDRSDLDSTNQRPSADTSQEDKTLVAAESAATEVVDEENLESKEENEQDTVELSGTAVGLADTQVVEETQTVIAPEQSQSNDTKGENPDAEPEAEGQTRVQKTFGEKNENFDDNRSTEKSAVPTESSVSTETKTEPTSVEQLEPESKNFKQAEYPVEDPEPAENIPLPKDLEPANASKVQPEVTSKTQEEPAGELLAEVRKKTKATETKTVERAAAQTTQTEPSEEPAVQSTSRAEAETEGLESDSPANQKPVNEKSSTRETGRQDSNPSPSVLPTESSALQDEPSLPLAENRPSVAASAPTSESASAPSPATVNLGSEATNRATGASTTASVDAQAEAEPVPTADRARFIQRVGGAIRSAQNRDGEIHLQLRPPELGSLRIEIVVKQGVLTARLETETSAARAIVLDNLPALRERLAEQEIRIEKFDVDVRDEGGRQSDQPDAEERKTNRLQQQTRNQRQTLSERHQPAPITPALDPSTLLSDGLDVRI